MLTTLISVLIVISLLSNILLDMTLVSADTIVTSVQVGKTPLIFKYDPENGKVDVISRDSNVLDQSVSPWGCIPETTPGCIDMTNTSSTYLSIAIGAVVGALISWFVYALQKRSTLKQDENLQRLKELDERHDNILKLIQHFQNHQEKLLEQILGIEKKIDFLIERKNKLR